MEYLYLLGVVLIALYGYWEIEKRKGRFQFRVYLLLTYMAIIIYTWQLNK